MHVHVHRDRPAAAAPVVPRRPVLSGVLFDWRDVFAGKHRRRSSKPKPVGAWQALAKRFRSLIGLP